MVSLPDVVPRKDKFVTLSSGLSLPVPGVDVTSLAAMLDHFPLVRRPLNGDAEDLTMEALIALAPDAVNMLIAAGTGERNTAPEYVAAAAGLSLGDKVLIMEALVEVTLPQGIAPFVESLTKMVGAAGGGVSGTGIKARASSLRKR
jgi:hypothetical protein